MGGAEDDKGISSSLDADENIYLTGSFKGTADFDPETGVYNMTSSGGTDFFLEKVYDCTSGFNDDLDARNGLIINPNPASGMVHIIIPSEMAGDASLFIYDIHGKIVYHSDVRSSELQIDLYDIPDGIYIVRLFKENSTVTSKLVKI